MILVVDDEPAFLEAAKLTLEAEGHVVETAPSAAEALQIASGNEPELILSDVRMPGMGGFEFREAYSRQYPARTTPFVFMTSLGEPEHVIRGLDSGADDYLVKPVLPGILRARVRMLLRRRQQWSAPSFRGDLSRFPFVKILRHCEVNGFTGKVAFEAPGLHASLVFHAGLPATGEKATDEVLDRLYDLNEGVFTMIPQSVSFAGLEGASIPVEEVPSAPLVNERPMGRLSAVEAGNRLIQVQTEFATSPKEQILTVALLDGRTLMKRVSPPPDGATRASIESQIDAQHAEVEAAVREKLATLARKNAQSQQTARERYGELFEAGFTAYREKRYEEALRCWEEAQRLSPGEKTVEVNIQIVKQKLAQASHQG